MPRDFVYRRRVQFAETDAAGIVHFANFYRYMEEAEHAMWRAAGVSIDAAKSEIGWPRVAAAFEFHRPLRFEEEFEVHVRITDMTEKTISYACEMVRDGKRIATGTMRIACARRRPGLPMQAIEIPAEIRRRLDPEEELRPRPVEP